MEANYFIILWWFLPYIHTNQPWVYVCFPSWTFLPPPFPSHPSGSSQCTIPEHPVLCIESGLVIYFTYDNIHVSMQKLQFFSAKLSLSSLQITKTFSISTIRLFHFLIIHVLNFLQELCLCIHNLLNWCKRPSFQPVAAFGHAFLTKLHHF